MKQLLWKKPAVDADAIFCEIAARLKPVDRLILSMHTYRIAKNNGNAQVALASLANISSAITEYSGIRQKDKRICKLAAKFVEAEAPLVLAMIKSQEEFERHMFGE